MYTVKIKAMTRSYCAPVTDGDGERACFAKFTFWFNKNSVVDQHVLCIVWCQSLLWFSDDCTQEHLLQHSTQV